jgi:pimeloyl-ACP methyl ester carboxylesterase
VKLLALLALLASCGPRERKTVAVDPAAHLEITSESVAFPNGSNSVPGTVVAPVERGRYAGIVIIAGSGPTDRDWNSPLIASKNGSAKLLAEALARHGAVVLRYDKAAIGANKTPGAAVTFDTYRDEARAGLALLRTRPDVDPRHVFVAGHSEGGEHALRVALAEGDHIAGVLLLSAGGRNMLDIIYGQLAVQIKAVDPAHADDQLAKLRAELDDFAAGKPPGKTLSALGVSPGVAAMSRDVMTFDPLDAIAKVAVPVFIYNGLHDVQVDPERDAKVLASHRAPTQSTTLFLAPEADHVLKHEPKSLAELHDNAFATQARYNAADRDLDPATVSAIVDWLAKQGPAPR